MTSRERFLKVFSGQIPDRVPVTSFIVDQGHFITQVYPDLDPYNHAEVQMKVIEIQKQLGMDVFARMVYDINPYHIHFGGVDVSQENENWEVDTIQVKNGNTVIHRSTIKTPAGVLTQDFSINEIRKNTFMYACTKKPVHTMEDLDIAIRYEPAMSREHRLKTIRCIERMKKAVGDDGILGVWAPHGPFNIASTLIDHTEMYSLFLTDIEFYKKLMNFALARTKDYMLAMDEARPDVLCVGGNVAGGFLGKRIFDEYVLPFEKQYVDMCQARGTPVMYHNCGQIMNLVESYKQLGCRIVEPFAPPPMGDADLAKAKEIVNGDYIIVGGVDQVNVLQNGTPEQIRKVTAQTMETGKQGGKFILQSVDFLEYGTPIKNLEAYVSSALEHASY
jgi:uroporphyrinogen-III decarboxylase